jgi:hypothetical protein
MKNQAIIVIDTKKTIPHGEKVGMKYLGTLDHPIVRKILQYATGVITQLLRLAQNFFNLGFY